MLLNRIKEMDIITKDKENALIKADLTPRPALCIAADYGQTDVVEILIEKGADVNVVDKYGITPLLAAIFEGHTACVKKLIQKGAKYKDEVGPDNKTYYDCAESDAIKAILKE